MIRSFLVVQLPGLVTTAQTTAAYVDLSPLAFRFRPGSLPELPRCLSVLLIGF